METHVNHRKVRGCDPTRRVAAEVWPWREAGEGEDTGAVRARARRARRQGAIRALVGLVAAAVIYRYWSPVAAAVVASIATIVLLLALVSPLGAYRRLDGWIAKLAYAIGLAVTWLLMPLLYYLVFFPVGLLLRARGRLRLTRRLEPRAHSYWTIRGEDGAESHEYRRQF